MRRILLFASLLSFLSVSAYAGVAMFGASAFVPQTYSGVTSNISFVAGTSFVSNPSVNFSAYTNRPVTVCSTTNNCYNGFISAMGAGETYSGNLVASNANMETVSLTYTAGSGTFASGDTVTDTTTSQTASCTGKTGLVLTLTTLSGQFSAGDSISGSPSGATGTVSSAVSKGWSAISSTLASIADERTGGTGTQSLQNTATSSQGQARQASLPGANGSLYIASVWMKSVSGNNLLQIGLGDDGVNHNFNPTQGTWTYEQLYWTKTSAQTDTQLQLVTYYSGAVARFDDASVVGVNTPSASGFTVAATRGGTAGTWGSNTGSPVPTVSSYTVTVGP